MVFYNPRLNNQTLFFSFWNDADVAFFCILFLNGEKRCFFKWWEIKKIIKIILIRRCFLLDVFLFNSKPTLWEKVGIYTLVSAGRRSQVGTQGHLQVAWVTVRGRCGWIEGCVGWRRRLMTTTVAVDNTWVSAKYPTSITDQQNHSHPKNSSHLSHWATFWYSSSRPFTRCTWDTCSLSQFTFWPPFVELFVVPLLLWYKMSSMRNGVLANPEFPGIFSVKCRAILFHFNGYFFPLSKHLYFTSHLRIICFILLRR